MKGETYLVDLEGVNPSTNSSKCLKDILLRFPKNVGLMPLEDTLIIKGFPVRNKEGEIGYTGIIALLESHLAIHFFPELSYVRLEFSTCKHIDGKKLAEAIESIFSPKHKTIECCKWNNK